MAFVHAFAGDEGEGSDLWFLIKGHREGQVNTSDKKPSSSEQRVMDFPLVRHAISEEARPEIKGSRDG
jgi:hypothetical protein